jgi:hypothetical protein
MLTDCLLKLINLGTPNMSLSRNPTTKPTPVMKIASKTEDVGRQPAMPVTQNSCGRSKVGQGQIIGGKFITRGAFPW